MPTPLYPPEIASNTPTANQAGESGSAEDPWAKLDIPGYLDRRSALGPPATARTISNDRA